MLYILIPFAILFSCGVYMVAADFLALPSFKASAVVLNITKREKKKSKSLDAFLLELSSRLSTLIKMDEYKKRKLAATLKSTGISLSPETFIARAWVKTGFTLLLIIPALLIFPVIAFVVIFLAIAVYFKEMYSVDEALKKHREAIESELPRFVMTVEQELKASRDVLRILETYKKNASPAFRHELEITCADMKSGSYEAALTRFETRVGSSRLSDVVRGLISVLRGDNGTVYFQMLAHDFKLMEVQKLKLVAMKRPSKIRKYSFFMLGCFILIYLVVMTMEIIKALGGMF